MKVAVAIDPVKLELARGAVRTVDGVIAMASRDYETMRVAYAEADAHFKAAAVMRGRSDFLALLLTKLS